MPLPDLNSTSLCEHDQNMDVSEGETLFPDLNSTEITQNDYLSSINTMNALEQEVTEESLGEVQSNDEHIRDADNDKHKVSSVNFFSLLIMWFSTFLFLTHALTSLCKMKCTLLALKRKVKRLEWEKKVHFEKIVCLQKELSTCKCKKPLHSTLLMMTRVLNFLLDLEQRQCSILYMTLLPPLSKGAGKECVVLLTVYDLVLIYTKNGVQRENWKARMSFS